MNGRQLSKCCITTVLLLLMASRPTRAQQTAVSGTVRATTGEAIVGARVRAVIGVLDTIVRTGARGTYELRLPSGDATFRVTNIGYAEVVRTVRLAGAPQVVDFTLVRNAQQLNEVNVSANWMGVRGIIADDSTKQPIAGAVVSVSRRNEVVLTDSAGRFALALPVAEHTVLQIAHAGYHTRAKGLDITKSTATEVTLFLTPGNDSRIEREALANLKSRQALGPSYSFTTSAKEVTRNGGRTVNDALYASGLLQRNGLRLGNSLCVFVNGVPMYGLSASRIEIGDVDFLEVYNGDPTLTLKYQWGNFPCPPVLGNPQVGNGRFVNWILVWTKK